MKQIDLLKYLVAPCLATFCLSLLATEASEPKTDPKISVEIQSFKDVKQRIAAHKGKVVVVEIWTSTCLTCVEKFPEFVTLQKQYAKQQANVVFISLCCDYDGIKSKPPEYYHPKVLRFLKKQEARFENSLLNVSLLDFLEKIELDSTPAVLVYGTDGKQAKRFDNDNSRSEKNDFTINHVKQHIDQLLKETNP